MDFKEQLTTYMEQLDCTSKELSEHSGLSASTISRYRSGERMPEAGSDNFTFLVKGLVKIAEAKGIASVTEEAITDTLLPLIPNQSVDPSRLQANFNALLSALPVSVTELAKYLNFDASYISRIRNGQRTPANPQDFAEKVAGFLAKRYSNDTYKSTIASVTGCKETDLTDVSTCQSLLLEWLTNGSSHSASPMTSFLEKLDSFNLDEYIRAIHFDELKVPTVPFQLPTSKSYYGIQEMMESELAFLKATVLSKSGAPVTMYSDMPMGEMAKDPDFPKKWMFGMAMMLKKGLHLNQIHNINRSFEEMMLGLESWIPMYMTGQISPYYLNEKQDHIFSHFLKVSGSVALTGEAIQGYHSEGKYYLTKNKDEVAYYRKRADRLLSKAQPLMDIYRNDRQRAYEQFWQADAAVEGKRCAVLSSFSLFTATDDLIERILDENHVPETDRTQILQYAATQRDIAETVLAHSPITEELPILTEEEFLRFPMTLSLSGMFYEKDIVYRWQDYEEHLCQIQEYQRLHANYKAIKNASSAFRNIQIYIHEEKWILVSKNKTPSIHFLIRHPKMRDAFENMVLPIIEE